MADKAKLLLNVFDGTRRPISENVKILVTLRDGNQKQVHRDYHYGPSIEFTVPFYNNLGDNYAVIAWADNYEQAGFYPIHVQAEVDQTLDLMLLPKNAQFNFTAAAWAALSQSHPQITKLLAAGSGNAVEAENRYNQLMTTQPKALACVLNLTTAMAQVHLPQGTPLDYVQQLIWDAQSIKQDRVFAYADKRLLDQIKLATAHGEFSPEPVPGFFHPGATVSYKQKQFGEANLQLSFHEGETATIGAIECMKLEADMDYYKDPLAHALLEVLPNHFHGPTDPMAAYVLRWIAGRHAGVPEFNPPYTIE